MSEGATLAVPRLLDLHNEVWDELNPYQRKPQRWIASSLGYCARRNVYERGIGKGDRSFDQKTLRTFAWGRFLHTQVRNILDDFGILVAEEVEVDDDELQVVGHGDAIIGGTPSLPTKPAKRTELWKALNEALTDSFGPPPYPLIWQEYKSVNSRGMQRLYNEDKPYPHQILQLATYRILAERNPDQLKSADGLAIELPEIWQLVCVGKDAWGVLTFGLNDRNVEEARERIAWLNDHWREEKLPPCECEPWMWKYNVCAYPILDEDGKATGCCPESLGEQVDWSK